MPDSHLKLEVGDFAKLSLYHGIFNCTVVSKNGDKIGIALVDDTRGLVHMTVQKEVLNKIPKK